MANIVDILKDAADIIGVDSSFTAAVSSTNKQVRRLLAMANKEGRESARRFRWQVLTLEKSFTSKAQEDQGALFGNVPDGIFTQGDNMAYVLDGTLWNRTERIPILGPDNPQQWQAKKALDITGPYPRFRISGGRFLMLPAPEADKTITVEFVTKNWVISAAGSVLKDEFTADDDIPLLDSDLILLGVIWRYKHSRGLEYGEDFASYERHLADLTARDGPPRVLSAADRVSDSKTWGGVVIPDGSWSVPGQS